MITIYSKDGCPNCVRAKTLLEQHEIEYKEVRIDQDDDARNFGQICHKLLLGGKDLVIVDAPDWRTAIAREQRESAMQAGKLPVLSRRADEANKLMIHVHAALVRHGLHDEFCKSQTEVTAIWKSSGVRCQGTLDSVLVPKKFSRKKKALIMDFKFTTVPATKRGCENRIIEHGYDIQHAAYTEAIETIFPKLAGRVEMLFVFVEVNPPHAVRVMPLSGSMKECGQQRWIEARVAWKENLTKYGTATPWPSYSDDGEYALCPPWILNEQIAKLDNFQPEAE